VSSHIARRPIGFVYNWAIDKHTFIHYDEIPNNNSVVSHSRLRIDTLKAYRYDK